MADMIVVRCFYPDPRAMRIQQAFDRDVPLEWTVDGVVRWWRVVACEVLRHPGIPPSFRAELAPIGAETTTPPAS